MGAGMIGGMVGNAIGGPVGRLIGSAIGAGVGQVVTNQLQGRPWDEGLLFNVGLSVATEGVMMGAEHWARGGTLGKAGRAVDLEMGGGRPSDVGDVSHEWILEELRNGNQHSQNIADLIDRGEIVMNIVKDETEFRRIYRQLTGEVAEEGGRGFVLDNDNRIFVNATAASLAEIPALVVHEATC